MRCVLDILTIMVALGGICCALVAAWSLWSGKPIGEMVYRCWDRIRRGVEGARQGFTTAPEKKSADGKSKREKDDSAPPG